MLKLNRDARVYITDQQTAVRVEVRYHSLSRKSGYVYIVEKESGNFRQVKINEVRYVV